MIQDKNNSLYKTIDINPHQNMQDEIMMASQAVINNQSNQNSNQFLTHDRPTEVNQKQSNFNETTELSINQRENTLEQIKLATEI